MSAPVPHSESPGATVPGAVTVPPALEAAVERRLAQSYGGVHRPLLNWAFGPVQVPPEAGQELRSLATRGTVVYVSRSSAFITFLFFQHLALRLAAPVATAAVGLGAKLWRPW